MKHATSRELYDYWNRIRQDEPAPKRSEIEPSDIRRILADTFILEVASRERFLVRLAGTRICSIYCREVKNTGFLDLWSEEDRQAVATLATAVSTDAAGAVITADLQSARRQTVACEILLLPLRHGGSGFNRILGSCAALTRPYWLGTDPIVSQRIASLRLIWPDDRPRFMRRASDRVAVPSAPIPFPMDRRNRRARLVVLDGGKR
ncbi:MAG: PAS domain-containing protein [Bauldia sp.]|nr:PAS domain-containing protein [Bauldia sp.]